jgi:hypothetical protein
MASITHTARVTGPVRYVNPQGKTDTLPLGPCLVEQVDEKLADIIWGHAGEESAVVPMKVVETAEMNGDLVLLD